MSDTPTGTRTAHTVAVLQGGSSLERTVSLRSGAQVQDALRRLGHDVLAIDAGPELVAELRAAAPDAVFIAMHGGDGEDGTVQGLLDVLGIPYTGSGPGACMRCTDKSLSKHLLREAGIPTPDFAAFSENAIRDLGIASALPELERAIGFPMVVKPVSQGSALGVRFARSRDDFPRAIVGALSYDRAVLFERYIRGRDLAVSVLDGPAGDESDGSSIALPVVEAIPRTDDFYDFESRYEIGMTTFVCPADLPDGVTERAQELALEVYRLLGCHGFARVDLMLDEDTGELTVLETNVVPGLTATSLIPLAADAADIDFDALIARILASAFTR